ITSGHVRRCTPENCVILSSKPVTSQRAAKKERRTPTTSRANATRNDAGSSRARRLTPALWQVGTQEGRRRARGPQRRSDNNRAARQDFHLVPCSLQRGHPCDRRLARSEARRQPSVTPCSGWSRPSRRRRWAPVSLDHPCARRHPKWQAGTEKRLASAEQRNCLSLTSVVCG